MGFLFHLIFVMLPLLAVITLVVIVVLSSLFGTGLGVDWLSDRFVRRRKAEADDTASLDQMDKEIAQLADRIAQQEQAGDGESWLTRAVLWRNRRQLEELRQRQVTLLAAQKRREAREKGVRTPGTELPARPFAVQAPVIDAAKIRR